MDKATVVNVRCQCGEHLLQLTWLPSCRGGGLDLAVWQSKGVSWRGRRWRHLVKILRTGEPYSDYLVLNREEVERLREVLDAYLDDGTTPSPAIDLRLS